jgi:hypothetical protein
MIQSQSKINEPIVKSILTDRLPWRALIILASLFAATLSLTAAGFQKFFIDSLTGDYAGGEKQQILFL